MAVTDILRRVLPLLSHTALRRRLRPFKPLLTDLFITNEPDRLDTVNKGHQCQGLHSSYEWTSCNEWLDRAAA